MKLRPGMASNCKARATVISLALHLHQNNVWPTGHFPSGFSDTRRDKQWAIAPLKHLSQGARQSANMPYLLAGVCEAFAGLMQKNFKCGYITLICFYVRRLREIDDAYQILLTKRSMLCQTEHLSCKWDIFKKIGSLFGCAPRIK